VIRVTFAVQAQRGFWLIWTPGSIMRNLVYLLVVGIGSALAATGCERASVPPTTAGDLMADSVTLENVLMRCNREAPKSLNRAECRTARVASARLAEQRDTADAGKRQAEFEHQRDALRGEFERELRQQELAKKVDPYTLPLVPPESPTTASVPSGKPQ
jgi:hypothetical protein